MTNWTTMMLVVAAAATIALSSAVAYGTMWNGPVVPGTGHQIAGQGQQNPGYQLPGMMGGGYYGYGGYQGGMMGGGYGNYGPMMGAFPGGQQWTQSRSSDSTGASGTSGVTGGSPWPFRGVSYSVQTVSTSDALAAMSSRPSGAKVFPGNNTVSFSGAQSVTILAFGMMPEDARNLTGMSPPSYATDDVFVVDGLIDPTLVVPSGANIQLTFVNLDDDMPHNFVATSVAPPYYYMPMMGTMWSNGGMMMGGGQGSGSTFADAMPILPPTDEGQGLAYYYSSTLSFSGSGGSYWYVCTYPGHAQGGMYGRMLVSA